MKRIAMIALATALAVLSCAKPKPLTREMAEGVVRAQMFNKEPVYAEVPQKVWFGPKSPEDDFDRLSVNTLRNLERAGLVTVGETHSADGMTTYLAHVTDKGFHILGTMPSARGPVYRGRICEKMLDGVQNFIRHPSDPTVGRAEIVWHYDNPTPLYSLFETKMNKPLKKPFVSLASFHWEHGVLKFEVTVKKTEAEGQ